MLIFPTNGYKFDTHTDIQNEFLDRISADGTNSAIEWLLSFKGGNELSHPRTLRFEWNDDGSEKYVFELSTNEVFSEAYKKEVGTPFCEIDNLEIGRKYFWRVNGCAPDFFYTADNSFRFIKIDGALNVRDIGGCKIKQGFIFRGSDIDLQYPITAEGIKTFSETLGIKSELELRKNCDGTRPSIAGDNVKLVFLPYLAYGEIFEDEARGYICKIIDFFSHEENYPVYIHCLGGADRTGMIAIFLRALVGEDDELIHTDYELTSLSSYAFGIAEGADATGVRSRNSDYYRHFLDLLGGFAPTGTLHDKVVAFLHDCGITHETIEKIINIIKK